MSTTPARYQPDTRLIDDEAQLRELYCEKDLTTREIARKHAEVGKTRVHQALHDYGIIEDDEDDEIEGMSGTPWYKQGRSWTRK